MFTIPVFAQEDEEFNSLLDSIKDFYQNNEFDKALELIETVDDSHTGLLFYKYQILAKMDRHQEALETYKKYAKVEEKLRGYNWLPHHEAILLYHLERYAEAEEVMAFAMLDIKENEPIRSQQRFFLGSSAIYLGMIEEKLGDSDLAEKAYAKATEYLVIRNWDCTITQELIAYGGYEEAMEILNSMNEQGECYDGSVKDLKTLVQKRINKDYSSTTILEPPDKTPDWVRNIFTWYAQKKISETELLNAIEFLTDHGILKKSFYD